MIKLLKRLTCNLKPKSLFWLSASLLILTASPKAWSSEVGSVCFKDTCFDSEIARTQIEKQRGLMSRTHLAPNEGMLFVYDQEGKPQFWMKNMRMALDFVWLDASGKTIKLDQDVPACRKSENCPAIGNSKPAKYILEIDAGAIQKAGIKIGDQAIIKLGETNAD